MHEAFSTPTIPILRFGKGESTAGTEGTEGTLDVDIPHVEAYTRKDEGDFSLLMTTVYLSYMMLRSEFSHKPTFHT